MEAPIAIRPSRGALRLLDVDVLEAAALGEPELALDLLTWFVDELRALPDSSSSGLHDPEALARLCHRLKSTAGWVGAARLRAAAEDLHAVASSPPDSNGFATWIAGFDSVVRETLADACVELDLRRDRGASTAPPAEGVVH